MARKQIEITLENRGNPLTFVIKEMPATQLESWIIRALLLAAGAGAVNVPEGADLQRAGAYLAQKGIGLLGSLDYDKAAPLLDEMLGCCYHKVDNHLNRCDPDNVTGYIEDVSTLFKLRMEAMKLNLGFFWAEDGPLSGFRSTPGITPQ
ncbi:MAG: hypothetical protein LBV79_08775 [Candidatus Adiutrix sp.]|jgi:hypothetical protein|nr:hypothetical protein [Candidatus Adiutrix sp.]